MQQDLPAGQDNIIMRNQEAYGFLPKDVIDRLGDTSTQLATEDQTALGAINELKSNLTDLDTTVTTLDSDSGWITTSSNTGKRRKVGKMVTIYFEFTVSATRTWHNIDTIPEGWRSSKDMYIAAIGGDHRQYVAGAKLDTATNTFRIYANTAATYYGSITYPVG